MTDLLVGFALIRYREYFVVSLTIDLCFDLVFILMSMASEMVHGVAVDEIP